MPPSIMLEAFYVEMTQESRRHASISCVARVATNISLQADAMMSYFADIFHRRHIQPLDE